ncbi:MAG: DUF6456 domain-containing protein [Hyphomicrobiales bacterium]|nr:DUF6456 domain-containing protein [Hyphomicrobiales bacterium]
MTRGEEQEVRRVLRRLTEPGSFLRALAPDKKSRYGLFVKRNRWKKAVMTVEGADFVLFRREGLLEQHADERYGASEAARALYRRLTAAGSQTERFAAQHQWRVETEHGARRNLAQTPLDWLKARQARTRKAGWSLTEDEFAAGERLARDYDASGMRTRMTMDWERPVVQAGRHNAGVPDCMLDARTRLRAALNFVGPSLQSILLAVCCDLCGLEEIESRFGWPRRSAKLVLKIALAQLVLFYKTGRRERANPLHHGAEPVGALRREVVGESQTGE